MSPPPRPSRGSLRGRLVLMLAAVVIASVGIASLGAIAAFDRAVEPELAKRTRLIGIIIRDEIQRVLELGIPIDAVAGLDSYLSATLEKFDEVDAITIETAKGRAVARVERDTIATSGRTGRIGEVFARDRNAFVLPVIEGNNLVGQITVEISPLFVQTRLRDVLLDVLVLALIATLVAVELAMAVTVSSVGKPFDRVLRLLGEQGAGVFLHRIRPGGLGGLGRMAARLNDHAEDLAERFAALPEAVRGRVDATIARGMPVRLRLSDFNDIRLALFVFSTATEIAAAFLPLFARGASRPDWLAPQVAAAAPLVAYLAAVAVLSPLGGRLARRFGPRRMFLASVPPTVLALLAMGASDSLLAITAWRAAMAVFYATATIAAQEYAIRAASGTPGARPFGAFVAVVYGGVFSGSALGGLLAGRFGYESAFVIGAGLAALAGAIGAATMRGRAGDAVARETAAGRAESAARPWLGLRYVALLAGIAVPTNAATAVFVWYMTPLMLSAAGSGLAEIGRVVMLYYLVLVLLGPAAARLAEGRAGPALPVVAGAAIAGAALLAVWVWSGFWGVAGAVACLGLGHTLIRAPLYSLALRITGGPGAGIDALRLVERLGSILGLGAAAWLLGRLDATEILRWLGLGVVAGAALYAIVEARAGFRNRRVTS